MLEGLDDEQLRRPMTRSGLSLLGLVKHLSGTEQGWFLKTYAGFDERTCERARGVVAAGSLDDVPCRGEKKLQIRTGLRFVPAGC